MDFPNKDNDGSFAFLYPTFENNETLKTAADKAGFRDALRFDGKEKAYRLYEDAIPKAAIDKVDDAVGVYATEESKVAAQKERAEMLANKQKAGKTLGANFDESKLYYPAKGNGDRDEFIKLREKSGATITYSGHAGAFVHRDGPTEGFEKFQTPEAKAAWKSEYDQVKKSSERRRNVASESVDTIAARAEGRNFLADNAKGFMLPSKEEAQVRDAQIASMKTASNEEVTQVYKITEIEKKRLEAKLYAIQITSARAINPELKDADFNKMLPDERRKVSNYASITGQDFAKLVANRAGFFELRGEMQDRGLLTTVDKAREASAAVAKEGTTSKAAAGVKSEKSEEKKAAPKKGNMAAQMMRDAQGMGR